ncbi:MAG TPA: MFS transporter [Rhizomicrobium sp.]|nr:MFS transporter [Rhizomicrobium sp.]
MIADEDRPARFLWLPPGARPPHTLPRRQEVVFLLVGMTLLFSGYDLNIFGMALPQIQRELHIPENMAGVTISYFRLAALAALFVAPLADLIGRRRLLLVTVFGEALMTLATAFVQDYQQFVAVQILARVFGYSEEMLCFVVVAEEIDARVRGWSIGTLGSLVATGAGLAALMFATVNYLPYGWRSLYVIGSGGLLILAYYRKWLPETRRFEIHRAEMEAAESRVLVFLKMVRGLFRDYPGRLVAMLVFVTAFGFTTGPSAVLLSKFLQTTHHYSPGQVSLLFVAGGLLSVIGNIAAGRLSDRLGRKRTLFVTTLIGGAGFALFYSGIGGWILPVLWVLALFGFLSSDALAAGYPSEIFPTAYRATATTLRYVFNILGGAIALRLEGTFYDMFHAHGPAIMLTTAALPVALVAIQFLPETARRSLEDISNPG